MTQSINERFVTTIAIFMTCMLPAGPLQASADVAFDFANIHADHGFGDMSGSDATMQYYLDGSQTGNGVGVTITGWQAKSNTRDFRNRTHKLVNFGNYGFGLRQNESRAQEAFDNDGRYDLVIFQFDQLMSLEQIGLGWVGSDYDLSVFGHVGPDGPVLNDRTFRYDPSNSKGLTNQGWELVGHYGENATSNVTVNSAGVMSSFWAIGAFTSAIIDASRTYGSPGAGNDYFTLRNLVGTVQNAVAVAEPSSGALMLLALGLLVYHARRRRIA